MTDGEAPRDGHPCYVFIIVHSKGGNGDQLSQPQEASSQEAHIDYESSLIKHAHRVANSLHLSNVYVYKALYASLLTMLFNSHSISINFLFYKQGNRLEEILNNLLQVKH